MHGLKVECIRPQCSSSDTHLCVMISAGNMRLRLVSRLDDMQSIWGDLSFLVQRKRSSYSSVLSYLIHFWRWLSSLVTHTHWLACSLFYFFLRLLSSFLQLWKRNSFALVRIGREKLTESCIAFGPNQTGIVVQFILSSFLAKDGLIKVLAFGIILLVFHPSIINNEVCQSCFPQSHNKA